MSARPEANQNGALSLVSGEEARLTAAGNGQPLKYRKGYEMVQGTKAHEPEVPMIG